MIEFLTVADVLLLHERQIREFGGTLGVRDLGLLESAVAQASASYGGEYLLQFPIEMASAYLTSLCANHPFLDGNKRVALASALVFLELNGVSVPDGTDALYSLTMDVAQGMTDRAVVARRLTAIVLGVAEDGS